MDDATDEAELDGFVGAEVARREGEFGQERRVAADAREALERPNVGGEANIDFLFACVCAHTRRESASGSLKKRLPVIRISTRAVAHLDGKDGPLRGAQSDVARRDQVQPGAEADPVDGGDDGLVALLDRRDGPLQKVHVLPAGPSQPCQRLERGNLTAGQYGAPL